MLANAVTKLKILIEKGPQGQWNGLEIESVIRSQVRETKPTFRRTYEVGG